MYIEGFGERMQQAIYDSGKTYKQIALQCGCDRRLFSNAYYYHTMPNSGNLYKFCKATGVSADWLLGLKK